MEEVIKVLLDQVRPKLAAAKQEHLGALEDGQEWGVDQWRELNPEYDVEAITKVLNFRHVDGDEPGEALRKVNPKFRGNGVNLVPALERKLALAVVAGANEAHQSVGEADLARLMPGHDGFSTQSEEQLNALDGAAEQVTRAAGDLYPGVAFKTEMKVDPRSNGISEAVVKLFVSGDLKRQEASEALKLALHTRTNVLRERTRRAALQCWEQVRDQSREPSSPETDPALSHFFDLLKKYGAGAFGLLSGMKLTALGDGDDALRGLLARLDKPEGDIIRNRFAALKKEGFTGEVAAMAIAAVFLMVDLQGDLPKKPKEDKEGIVRGDYAMDLYEFADALENKELDPDELTLAYWALTKKVRKLKGDLKKHIRLPDEEE